MRTFSVSETVNHGSRSTVSDISHKKKEEVVVELFLSYTSKPTQYKQSVTIRKCIFSLIKQHKYLFEYQMTSQSL